MWRVGTKRMHHVICVAFLWLLVLAPASQAGEWQPDRNIEISVGSSPGSGTDATARLIEKLFRKDQIVSVPVTVLNKPGGGSAIVMAYLAQHQGNAHFISVAAYNLVTNKIQGRSNLGIADFTPLAFLFNDFIAFNVKSDSSIRNGRDLIDRMKADPQSVTFGLSSSIGGANHIALGLLMRAAGIDVRKLKVVVFNSGGKSSTALLGGHVDVQVVSASVAQNLLAANKIRILGVTAPHRLHTVMSKVPTWKELGLPVRATNWRIAIAPKGISDEQVAYWDRVFKRLTQLDEWKSYIYKSFSDDAYLDSHDTRKYLQEQYVEVKSILEELGLAK